MRPVVRWKLYTVSEQLNFPSNRSLLLRWLFQRKENSCLKGKHHGNPIGTCFYVTWPCMSPQTVTGVWTGCTFGSSNNKSHTMLQSSRKSSSGKYLHLFAISIHLSTSLILLMISVFFCKHNRKVMFSIFIISIHFTSLRERRKKELQKLTKQKNGCLGLVLDWLVWWVHRI